MNAPRRLFSCPSCHTILSECAEPHCKTKCPVGWVRCKKCHITINPATGRFFENVGA